MRGENAEGRPMLIDDIGDYLRLATAPRPSNLATNSTLAVPLKLPTAEDLMRSFRDLAPDRPRPRDDASDALAFGISRRSIAPASGFRIVEDPHMTKTVEDWSDVRSPSRAARRRRQGHRQRICWVERPKPDIYCVGDMLVMHPETARVFREKVAASGADMARRAERQMLGALLGFPSPLPRTSPQSTVEGAES